MNCIYEKLYDGYAEPLLRQNDEYLRALLSPLPLSPEQQVSLAEALTSLCLQQSTDAFTVGLHLGLSLFCDNVRRHSPQ